MVQLNRPRPRVPPLLYGTAWKELATQKLVELALASGFRGIDTANQRKHYYEEAVGKGIAASKVARGELFLQTKFTYVRGQDHRLPYDPAADIRTQVEQSFESSLLHLGTDVVDSYVLHGPWSNYGWSGPDRDAWAAMEQLHAQSRVRWLGVSNVSLEQLEALCAEAEVQPTFVQNRCYARQGWDREVRRFCTNHGIVYQAFSLLTANARELSLPLVHALARRVGGTVPQVVFRFAQALGMLPLTGTSDPAHMTEDLAAGALLLSASDLAMLERIGG